MPADSILLTSSALLDYSFDTSESKPADAKMGDLLYAGVKVTSSANVLEVLKLVNQSRLIKLWNNQK